MRMADIALGDEVLVANRTRPLVTRTWVGVRHRGRPKEVWPAMVIWRPATVVRKRPRGVLVVEESYTTWDYENRPDGSSLTAWQMGTDKRPVRRTKQWEISARRVRACKQSSLAGHSIVTNK